MSSRCPRGSIVMKSTGPVHAERATHKQKKNAQQKGTGDTIRTADCRVRILVSNLSGAPAPEQCSAEPASRSRPQIHILVGVVRASQQRNKPASQSSSKSMNPTAIQQAKQLTHMLFEIHSSDHMCTHTCIHTRTQTYTHTRINTYTLA